MGYIINKNKQKLTYREIHTSRFYICDSLKGKINAMFKERIHFKKLKRK